MKLSRLGCLALGASFLLLGGHEMASQQVVNYHLINTISLPPAAGNRESFDYLYVDPDARRVYVTHGTEVIVLNANTYSVNSLLSWWNAGLLSSSGGNWMLPTATRMRSALS